MNKMKQLKKNECDYVSSLKTLGCITLDALNQEIFPVSLKNNSTKSCRICQDRIKFAQNISVDKFFEEKFNFFRNINRESKVDSVISFMLQSNLKCSICIERLKTNNVKSYTGNIADIESILHGLYKRPIVRIDKAKVTTSNILGRISPTAPVTSRSKRCTRTDINYSCYFDESNFMPEPVTIPYSFIRPYSSKTNETNIITSTEFHRLQKSPGQFLNKSCVANPISDRGRPVKKGFPSLISNKDPQKINFESKSCALKEDHEGELEISSKKYEKKKSKNKRLIKTRIRTNLDNGDDLNSYSKNVQGNFANEVVSKEKANTANSTTSTLYNVKNGKKLKEKHFEQERGNLGKNIDKHTSDLGGFDKGIKKNVQIDKQVSKIILGKRRRGRNINKVFYGEPSPVYFKRSYKENKNILKENDILEQKNVLLHKTETIISRRARNISPVNKVLQNSVTLKENINQQQSTLNGEGIGGVLKELDSGNCLQPGENVSISSEEKANTANSTTSTLDNVKNVKKLKENNHFEQERGNLGKNIDKHTADLGGFDKGIKKNVQNDKQVSKIILGKSRRGRNINKVFYGELSPVYFKRSYNKENKNILKENNILEQKNVSLHKTETIVSRRARNINPVNKVLQNSVPLKESINQQQSTLNGEGIGVLKELDSGNCLQPRENVSISSEVQIKPCKRGTLKFLKQREKFLKTQRGMEEDDDIFSSTFGKQHNNGIFDIIGEMSSIVIKTPKDKDRGLNSDTLTPRTALMSKWVDNIATPSSLPCTPAAYKKEKEKAKQGALEMIYQLTKNKKNTKRKNKNLNVSRALCPMEVSKKSKIVELPDFEDDVDAQDDDFDDYF